MKRRKNSIGNKTDEGTSKDKRRRQDVDVKYNLTNDLKDVGTAVEGAWPEPTDHDVPALHPLQIYVVLRELFKYCTELEEVKRNRLVCRNWKDASELQWTDLKTLTLFRKQEDLQSKNFEEGIEGKMTLKQFNQQLGDINKEIGLHYRKFKLQDWEFDKQLVTTLLDSAKADRIPNLRLECWFWRTISLKVVSTLTLENCSFPNRLIIFRKEFLGAFPNLNKLNIRSTRLGEPAALWERNKSCICAARIKNLLVPHNYLAKYADEDDHTYQHSNLKSISVEAWSSLVNPERLNPFWSIFLKMVPNLEVLQVRGSGLCRSEWKMYLSILFNYDLDNVAGNLKVLDILDFSVINTSSIAPFYEGANFPKLEVFKYNGCKRAYKLKSEMQKIARHMPNLKELHLYQPPLQAHCFSLFTNVSLNNLKELHLWGTITHSMNFLNSLPNLSVLVWITKAYEAQYHGKQVLQVCQKFGEKVHGFSNEHDPVENAGPLLTLVGMTKLELDWCPKSKESWTKLGECMPNLKSFKALITSHQWLCKVQQLWPALQNLELAHGTLLNGQKVITAVSEFKNLWSFAWKGCLCSYDELKKEYDQNVREEEAKKSDLPWQVIFPWHFQPGGPEDTSVEEFSEFQTENVSGSGMCAEGKYNSLLRKYLANKYK